MNLKTKPVAAAMLGLLLGAGVFTACGLEDTKPTSAKVQPSADSKAAEYTYVVTIGDKLVQEPRKFDVDNSDFVRTLDDLVWSGWGEAEATATGTLIADTRTNGEGRLVTYQVTVTATGLTKGEASQTYSTLKVVATGDTQGYPKEETFDISRTATTDDSTDNATNKATNKAADYTYLVDVQGEPLQQPETMKVDNSDFVRTLKNLQWTNWGTDEATATGTMVADSRTGGEGRLVTYPVTVTATELAKGEAGQTYSKLNVVATGDTQGYPKQETFELGD